jgi:hypothetical protein
MQGRDGNSPLGPRTASGAIASEQKKVSNDHANQKAREGAKDKAD